MATQYHDAKTPEGRYWRRFRVRHLGLTWSRVELARHLGVSERTAQRWECRPAGPPTVWRYALLGFAFVHGHPPTPASIRTALDGPDGGGS